MKKILKIVITFVLFFLVSLLNQNICEAKEIKRETIIDLEVATESSTTEEPEPENESNSVVDDLTESDLFEVDDTQSSIGENEESFEDITENLVPKISTDDFFKRVYNKLFATCSGIQKILAVVLIILFLIGLFALGASLFGNRTKTLSYAVAELIIVILFFCDIYAVQIVTAVNNWLAS